MSISTAIQNAQEKVRNAYTAVSDKGGTVPTVQNLNNLPEAINSISGGGGDVVEAYALDGAKNAHTGDKVVLNNPVAANTMLMDGVEAPGTVYFGSSNKEPYMTPGGIITGDSILFTANGSGNSTSYMATYYGSRTSDTSWSLTKATSTSDNRHASYCFIPVDYSRNLFIRTGYYSSSNFYIGSVSNGAFVDIFSASGAYINVTSATMCNNILSFQLGGPYIYPYLYNGNTFTEMTRPVNSGTMYYVFYNGEYYSYAGSSSTLYVYKYSEETSSWSSTGNTVTGLPVVSSPATTSRSFVRYLGDFSGKYLLVKNAAAGTASIYERTSGAPGESNITYSKRGDLSAPFASLGSLVCHDVQTDPVSGYTYIYLADFNCNQVFARFKNGELEVLPPPFDKDSIGTIRSATMNWNEGLFMCASTNPDTTNTNLPVKVYVKSTDVAAPFEFVANSFADRYVVSDSLTGFVQDTREGFGSKILTVATAKDPNKEPWSPIGKLFGFKVTVNKGEE